MYRWHSWCQTPGVLGPKKELFTNFCISVCLNENGVACLVYIRKSRNVTDAYGCRMPVVASRIWDSESIHCSQGRTWSRPRQWQWSHMVDAQSWSAQAAWRSRDQRGHQVILSRKSHQHCPKLLMKRYTSWICHEDTGVSTYIRLFFLWQRQT